MQNSIKMSREYNLLTQQELASAIGVSRRTIVSIEAGQTMPALDIAFKIATALKKKVDEIFVLSEPQIVRYVDLFCGIGGFRYALERAQNKLGFISKCVMSCDIDPFAQQSYQANFGELPLGDITKINTDDIPDHDILFAGFPCQPFSIIGKGKGFEDTRGTLFFEIARVIAEKQPSAFILENVKRLVNHQNGETFQKIITTLQNLGYCVQYKVLNALDYGLPQKRERVLIVGAKKTFSMQWPAKFKHGKTLEDILEKNVPKQFYASKSIIESRKSLHTSKHPLSIWHENKGGNVSSYPYSCALRAGASYNYLLVNGERRLTPREMLRLQGFPDSFKTVVSDAQIRKQAGNSIPIDMIAAVIENFVPLVFNLKPTCIITKR